MKKDKLNEAEHEAKRFLRRIQQLKGKAGLRDENYYWLPKQTGAVRRSSMDLTRALAELRKHG